MKNRIIKFRVWDTDDNKMIALGDAIKDELVRYFHGDNELQSQYDSDIVMQYTGLIDKHGKEIYEGDIIHYLRRDYTRFDSDYDRTFVIEWRDGMFVGKDSQIKIKDIAGENSEIIGNIYENPELLSPSSEKGTE